MVKFAQCSSDDRCGTILLAKRNEQLHKLLGGKERGGGRRKRRSYFRFGGIVVSISNDKLSCIRNKRNKSVAEKRREMKEDVKEALGQYLLAVSYY